MTNVTFAFPPKTYARMKHYPQLRWGEIVRESVEETLKELEESGLREYSLRRLAKEGEDAHELFKF